MDAVSLQRVGSHLPHRVHILAGSVQNQPAAEVGCDSRPEGVERLRQIQAAGCSLRRSKHGHVRISRHLQGGDPRCQHHQRTEKQRVRGNAGSGDEQKRAQTHGAQARYHRLLVSNPIDHFGGRNREQEIGRKERKLDQHHLGVVQVKDGLQVRHQHIDQDRDEAPHEKQGGHHCQRDSVAGRRRSRGTGSAWNVCDCHGLLVPVHC
jgi:hypothetical protein